MSQGRSRALLPIECQIACSAHAAAEPQSRYGSGTFRTLTTMKTLSIHVRLNGLHCHTDLTVLAACAAGPRGSSQPSLRTRRGSAAQFRETTRCPCCIKAWHLCLAKIVSSLTCRNWCKPQKCRSSPPKRFRRPTLAMSLRQAPGYDRP